MLRRLGLGRLASLHTTQRLRGLQTSAQAEQQAQLAQPRRDFEKQENTITRQGDDGHPPGLSAAPRLDVQKPDLVEKYMGVQYKSTVSQRWRGRELMLKTEYGHNKYRPLNEEQMIVVLTEKINARNQHMKTFYQDLKKRAELQTFVARRFRLLANLRYDDFPAYCRLITRLGLPDTFHERSFPMVDPVGTNVKGLISVGTTSESTQWDPSKVNQDDQDDQPPNEELVGSDALVVGKQSEEDGVVVGRLAGSPQGAEADAKVKGALYSVLEARLRKHHEEKVYAREKELAVARIQQIEHFYIKMLQDKVWRDLRLDVVQPERPNAAYMPPIDAWWATKQRMVQPPDELRKRAAADKISKRWQRIIKPWRVDGTRKGIRAQKIHFNRHIFHFLRRWAPLFYESKMYRTSEWRDSPYWQGAPAPYILKHLGLEARQVMRERQWKIVTGQLKRPTRFIMPKNHTKTQKH